MVRREPFLAQVIKRVCCQQSFNPTSFGCVFLECKQRLHYSQIMIGAQVQLGWRCMEQDNTWLQHLVISLVLADEGQTI